VSLHFAEEAIDSGEIAFQSPISKTWEDTGETLYKKAQKEMLRLFKNKFPEIKAGRIPRRPQDLKQGSFHHSRELEAASKIDLEKTYTGRALLNILRGRSFSRGASAWFQDNDQKYEVKISIKKVEQAS
jgi:methionyl-tRNA formyltransferase